MSSSYDAYLVYMHEQLKALGIQDPDLRWRIINNQETEEESTWIKIKRVKNEKKKR